MGDFINFLGNNLADFWTYTGFANATVGHIADDPRWLSASSIWL